MHFVKPSPGDNPGVDASKWLSWSTCDPHHSDHQVLDKQLLDNLLSHVQESVPHTGLQQFWNSGSPSISVNVEVLWRHVIFSRTHTSTIMQENFLTQH